MNINERLAAEVSAMQSENDRKAAEERRLMQLAKEDFAPVMAAAHELERELGDDARIQFNIGDYFVGINLGKDWRIEACRDGWIPPFDMKGFGVTERKHYEYPEPSTNESKRQFNSADEVIDFLVKACAQFRAR